MKHLGFNSVANGQTMKNLSVELGPWLATAMFVSALAGCGSEAVGGDEKSGSTASELGPTHLDAARNASLMPAAKPEVFERTPDDGNGRPISDELRAQIEVELKAHSFEKLDRKTLKGGAAFTVGFANNATVAGQVIANSSTYICYLQTIAFWITNPTNPEFFLKLDNNSPANIVAYKDPGPAAGVRCVPRDFFSTSGSMKPLQTDYNYTFLWDQCGAYQASSGKQGHNVEMIAGIGYDYTGSSDNFGLIQADSSSQMNQFRIQQNSGACRGVGFTAPVFFNKTTVTFEGPNGVGTASAAGEYSYSATASLYQPLTHGGTPVSALDSECYFTYLGGAFAGPADVVTLGPDSNNNWVLQLLGTSGGVSAKVRCVRHIQ